MTISCTSTSDTISQPQVITNEKSTANRTTALLSSQQLKRQTARSISECVDIGYVDERQQNYDDIVSNDNNNDDDDDDAEYDFATLSEMNDFQNTQASSSSAIVAANIKFTTKTTSTSSSSRAMGVINAEIISDYDNSIAVKKIEKRQPPDSDHHRNDKIDDRQNLLANFSCSNSYDVKSNELYCTDNESINSIGSKTEISKGLVVKGNMEQTNDDTTTITASFEANANNNTKANNDAFTSFFSNINAGK